MKKDSLFSGHGLHSWVLFVLAVTSVVITGCTSETPKKTLSIFTWSEYIDDALIAQFEKDYNCKVEISTFDSNEAMLAKLEAGATGYDIITPTTYIVMEMKRKDLIQKIDLNKIPNFKYMDEKVVAKLGKETCEYGVPYFVGITGLGYNKDKFPTPPDSWDVFSDEKHKGRMTLLNDSRETIGSALMYLKYNPNTLDDAQLAQARDLVLAWKKNIAKFEVDEAKSGLASGEFDLVHYYSGDIVQLSLENEKVGFAVPKEGALFAADHLVITKSAPNAELAHAFINFLSEPKNAAQNMEEICYIAPIPEAIKLLPSQMQSNPLVGGLMELISNCKMSEDLGEDTKKYADTWQDICSE